MKLLTFTLILVMTSLSSANLLAEKPLSSQLPNTDITGLVLAKFQNINGQERVGLRIPAWKENLRTERFEVEVPVTELRKQEVIKNGKKVVDEVPVNAVKVETRTRTVASYVPKDPVKGEIALARLKAWNLRGEELSTAELKSRLSKTTYFVCLAVEPTQGVPPLDPFYANAFRSDTLIVYSAEIEKLFQASVEKAESDVADNFKDSGAGSSASSPP